MNTWVRIVFVVAVMGLMACSDQQPPAEPKPTPTPTTPAQPTPPPVPPTPPATPVDERSDEEALLKRGGAVYAANCIACHNVNPALDGAIGPAIKGSSFELLEARIMRNEYPEGYTPKRDTKAMIALPYLEPDIPAIAAFLAE
jgi:mono/diheme cytochrome c family protein